jgi:hypothetical protein
MVSKKKMKVLLNVKKEWKQKKKNYEFTLEELAVKCFEQRRTAAGKKSGVSSTSGKSYTNF